jgi:protein-S-isoprenylcysteine O-methyltransferase Ste14
VKAIDKPPVWLLVFISMALSVDRLFPTGLSLESALVDFISAVFIGGGVILLALAVSEMRRAGTTLDPYGVASKLITSGIFKRSRNPIYLGYLCILTGVLLCFDTILSLPLVPIFLWYIERRFVIPEENALRRTFRMEFARYSEKTRRWV